MLKSHFSEDEGKVFNYLNANALHIEGDRKDPLDIINHSFLSVPGSKVDSEEAIGRKTTSLQSPAENGSGEQLEVAVSVGMSLLREVTPFHWLLDLP